MAAAATVGVMGRYGAVGLQYVRPRHIGIRTPHGLRSIRVGDIEGRLRVGALLALVITLSIRKART